MKERRITVFKNYFWDFYNSLEKDAKIKVDYSLSILKTENKISPKFVKSIRNGLYELRSQINGNIFRVFFIFDKGNLVVLFSGFQKKTQKTPESEIKRALKIMNEYYEEE